MTVASQSPYRDGGAPIQGGRNGSRINLRSGIKLATWNVMTLSGIGYQVALVRELARFDVCLAGITEARIPGNGCRQVEDALILHSGGDQRMYGVALVVRPPFNHALMEWHAISDRLLLARFTHKHGHLSVVVAYAPTEPTEDYLKDRFYDQLSSAIQSIPPHDIVTVLGDFNASSGTADNGCGVVGPFGSGHCNDNSERLTSLCSLNELTILGTWFRRLDIHRWTWLSHDGITKKEIDHVITRQRDKGLFKSLRTFRSGECPANTDHVLLITELRLALMKPKKSHTRMRKHDVTRLLQESDLQSKYNIAIENRFNSLGDLPEDVEELWTSFRTVVREVADEVVGFAKKVRKPWLSTETVSILEQKAEAKLQGRTAERRRLQGLFKAKAKADQESYLNRIAEQVEEDLSHNHLRSAFRAINHLSGRKARQINPTIQQADGTPCASMDECLLRWKEHFEAALNHSPGDANNTLQEEAESAIPDEHTSVEEPSLEEVISAIGRLRNGRAPGGDGIESELLTCAVTPIARCLHALILRVWRTGQVPAEWKDGIIVTLYKGKGPRNDCSSYRPISLLSVSGKVFAHVLLARINPLLVQTRRPQQSGFTAGRSTIDAILALRLLSEIHREFDRPLVATYVDIKAAFDSVDRRALWRVLRSKGVPDILLDLIAGLHDCSGATVRINGKLSPRFSTTSGVRQGCILAPALFCAAMDWIIDHMTFKPKVEVGTSAYTDLVYADDTTFLNSTASDAITCLSSFGKSAAALGLRISWNKTKLQGIGSGTPPPTLSVDGNSVEVADDFTYLGSVQSSNGYSKTDILRRIGMASSAMSSLRNIWKNKKLSLKTKTQLYQTLVQSVLLYASETWTLLAADLRTLEAFHMRCQRQILCINWWDRIRNSQIAETTGLPSIADCISRRRNAIFGHVARLQEDAPAHHALRCQVNLVTNRFPDRTWKRTPGRPRKRWIDQLRDDNTPVANLWRQAVNRGHSGATLRSAPIKR